LRSIQGGFGLRSVSEQPRTIAATRAPKRAEMSSRRRAALILDRVVQERGNRLVLAAAVLED
jgi:hypothetical protein